MNRFTRCMFCVVAERDKRTLEQLQAALLEELDNLHRSIEQSLGAFEARIEERTPARSGEASHSRTGEAGTEDLRKEFSSFKEQVFHELDGMWSKIMECGPRLWNVVQAVQSEADPPGDASKACSPGRDEEAFIEDAWVRVVKKAARPNIRL